MEGENESSSNSNNLNESDPQLSLAILQQDEDLHHHQQDHDNNSPPSSTSSSSSHNNPSFYPYTPPPLLVLDTPNQQQQQQQQQPRSSTPTLLNFIDPNLNHQDEPKWVEKVVEYPQPLYPHAKPEPAKIHSLNYLLQNHILIVSKDFKCGNSECNQMYKVTYDIQTKFQELVEFIRTEKDKSLNGGVAPEKWLTPTTTLPECSNCRRKCDVDSLLGSDDRVSESAYHKIDWLFLLLGRLLGVCEWNQLNYFCINNNIDRSVNGMVASTSQLLYRVYFDLCRQLQPHQHLFITD
ncbi:uncharacterized protein [Spinacia oleracea]|uniref:DUF7086 domain-containing protein n=1 Tax=Spinacia oleracea TaxID=3562 RepID=A0A9R0IHN8_SPIOL|nr:uncharacterized protein LOC110789133 [Spinacia oleracea]